MKFKNWLNELFNTDINIVIKKEDKGLYYKFEFNVYDKIFFFTSTGYNRKFNNDVFFEIAFGNEYFKTDITGELKLKSSQLFSAINKCLKIFIIKENPKYFYFTAKESSRKKLYDRFVAIIEKQTNYKLDTSKETIMKMEKLYLIDSNSKIYIFKKD